MGKLNSPLATPSATIDRLQELGLYTKHALGQHFLVDDNTIGRIMALASVKPGDFVIEVGPGIGTLTLALQAAGAQIIAIEYDEALATALVDLVNPARVKVIHADAAKIDLQVVREISGKSKGEHGGDLGRLAPRDFAQLEASPTIHLVSNLPYQIATAVILRYFTELPELNSATVMVQREVADRICAKPNTKDYSAYTVKLALRAKVTGRFEVSRSNFLPPPRVDSSVIKLERLEEEVSGGGEHLCATAPQKISTPEEYINLRGAEYSGARGSRNSAYFSRAESFAVDALINDAFTHRRKTLRNNLGLSANHPYASLRAEALTPAQFLELLN